ncbi:hypothetical protein MMC30_008965 [Trapelia coarctata]|nr:hypothetical protein [Trapelia coarctata]
MDTIWSAAQKPALMFLLLPVSSAATYLLTYALYNLYINPLSRFPGPKLWAVSRIPYVLSLQRGDFHQVVKRLHDQYGPIVRLGPNELSFTHAQAWQDIYGHHQGRTNFPKNTKEWMKATVNETHSILSANNADHSRIRRLLAHAFSDKAMRAQEPLIQSYITLLIAQLRKKATASPNHTATVDITEWFNFTLFDITGDLSFGEPFGCLETGKYHPWIALLFQTFKAITLLASSRFIPGAETLLRYMLPKSIMQKRKDHFELARSRVHKRLEEGDNSHRPDFITYICRYNDEKGMTIPEIEATFAVLVIAGSETTATVLSGITSYLLKSPESMRELETEICGAFKHEEEISVDRVTKLPFLNAVIEEGLRLCPPVPAILPRWVPPEGDFVCGEWLPGYTNVSIPQFATYRSPINFSSPDAFLPHRWLKASPSSHTKPFTPHNPTAFQPFSTGPRNCIGKNLAYLEMRLIIAKLVWNFEFLTEDAVEGVGEGGRMGDGGKVGKVGREGGKGRDRDWGDQRTFVLWEKEGVRVGLRVREGGRSMRGV